MIDPQEFRYAVLDQKDRLAAGEHSDINPAALSSTESAPGPGISENGETIELLREIRDSLRNLDAKADQK